LNVRSIGELLNFLLVELLINTIAPIIITVMLIWSGFLFVTAQGNPTKIADARKAFFWTVVGGIILLGASVIFSLVTGTINELTAFNSIINLYA